MPARPIGMIGLGLLGAAIAERMLQAGYPILGFDLSAQRTQEHVARGGLLADSVVQITSHSTIVLCLPDSKIVSQVAEELLPFLQPNSLLIDATTGDPEHTVALAKRLRERSIAYIDATIGGSSQQVREGTAIVMAGGDPAPISQAKDLLDSWGKQWFHVGPPGSGARMKLVLNLALGLQRAVLAEALAFAQACEIDPAAALQILRASPAYSICMDTKGQKMLAGDFTPQARLAQHYKDVLLIQALATRAGVKLPLSTTHEEILQRAIALGWGDADNSAILCPYQNRAAAPELRSS